MPTIYHKTVDITPTWVEWASVYTRLAESKEVSAIKILRPDLNKAMAAADALQALIKSDTLTDKQMSIITPILARG